MIQLASILHSKGFTISIIHTQFNSPNPSNYPHFTFHLISDGLSETEKSTKNVSLLVKLLLANCVEPFRDCLAQLLSEDVHVTCLISDAIWYFTQAIADSFKLPRIVLRTSNACSFLAFTALPLLQDRGYLSDMDSKMEEAVVELPPLKVKDIPRIEPYDPTDMYQIIRNMMAETKKSSGLIFNTFKELEETELAKLQQQFLIPVLAIGPLHKCFSAASTSLLTQDRSSISWLDKQAPNSVLYVSFGSIAAMDSQKLLEVAWGLANSHINPMIQLASILHSKDGLSETEKSTKNVSLLVKLLLANCVEPFRDCLAQLLSDDVHVTCLISDALWYFTQAIADSFKLPRIVLRTSNVCSFLAFYALPLLRDRGYLSDRDSKMEEAVVELPPLKVKDIPRIEQFDPADMYAIIVNMMDETKKSSGLIFNTFKELEETELAQTSAAISHSSISNWTIAQMLFSSLNHIAAMDSQKLLEVAWGLANSMQPFLWAVRPGLIEGSDWLEMLPNEFLQVTRSNWRKVLKEGKLKMLLEREGEEMKKRVLLLKEKVNLCLKSGGSSYQSIDALVNLISSFRSST
ncbi:hypothetical protein BUALT_Bualt01G0044300 [Buddleja alternifolia]|uniref:Uncharacterized protein n=1 Tax=Buddleja alternifolia TaxID=168488 RepID=A0AAV6YD04_9LAMI|nr:hypothetical protein BUALT_Bualt01G0044300 [Buddleja alternifolia]